MRPIRFVFALLIAACATGAVARPEAGDLAPDFVGNTLDDRHVSLADYRGKLVVVSFWASWCPPCRKELPILEGIQKVAGKDHMRVIAVNTESIEVFQGILQKLSALDLMLTHDVDHRSADAYGVHGIPHMVIIDRSGRIVRVNRGYSEDELDRIIADINQTLLAK